MGDDVEVNENTENPASGIIGGPLTFHQSTGTTRADAITIRSTIQPQLLIKAELKNIKGSLLAALFYCLRPRNNPLSIKLTAVASKGSISLQVYAQNS